MPFGLVQGVVNAFGSGKANKRLDKLLGQDPQYKKNPFADARLGIAQQMFNGRMGGAAEAERNIFANQASTASNIQRNSTDAATALSYLTGLQGQTNEAVGDLQLKEAGNKQNMLGNLNSAYETMIGEGDKLYQDKVRRFGNLAQVRGMQQQNRFNAVNGIFNGLNSDLNDVLSIVGMGGGFGG